MYLLNLILSISIVLLPFVEEGITFISNDVRCELSEYNSCCTIDISHISCCIANELLCGCHISNSSDDASFKIKLVNSNYANTKNILNNSPLSTIYNFKSIQLFSFINLRPEPTYFYNRYLPLLI